MGATRFHFGVLGLGIVLTFAGTSSAGAQCAALACAGTADCSVNAASGVDAPGCCTTSCKTIQFAVGQVAAGAVIKVAAGTYPENAASSLNINKTVTLCGANAGTDARGSRVPESIITNERGTTVSADNVVLDGFTFQDAGMTQSNFPYGVDMAQGTQGTQVYNNIIQNNIYGIGLANTGPTQVLVCQNLLQNNNNPGSASGSGIYTDQFVCGNVNPSRPCTNFLITENVFKGHVGSPDQGAAINLSNTDMSPMTNVDIGNNTFDMNNRAVLLFNVDTSTIHNNTMTGSTFAGSGDIRIFGTAAGGGVDGLTITSNNMSGGAGWAIRITDGPNTNITIHLNNIANYAGDNSVPSSPNPGGLFLSAGAYPGVLDATCNWWNDPCGPFNVANNPTGPGEEVREGVPSNVNFISWLVAPGPAPASGSGMCSGTPSTCKRPDHFQCYEIKPKAFATVTGVSVEDQFGQHTETVRFPHRLCAPANKNGEDPTAPNHPDHLQGHLVSGPNVKVANLTVTNSQFGTLKLDIVKPDILMVPTLKSLDPNKLPEPLTDPVVDHFQCYKAKRSKGSPKFQKILGVNVQDQFGTATLDLLKPIRLCAPANKNGEDPTAPQHPFHLLCYKTKNSAFGMKQAFTNDQFGSAQPLLIHRRELCVPSTKSTGSSTTTTTPVTTTTSSTGPITTTTTSSTSTTVTTTTTTTSSTTTTSTTTTSTSTTTTSSTSTTTTSTSTTTTTDPCDPCGGCFTVTNCGACGNVCPGYQQPNDNVTCDATQTCTFSCQGEHYDVNNDPSDGCEVTDSPQGNHLSSTPASAGPFPACDTGVSVPLVSGTLPSDGRVHQNPSVVGFDAPSGSAPDWISITPTTSTFCQNDIVATLNVMGSAFPTCYKLTIISNSEGLMYSCQTMANGSCSISQDNGGQFADGASVLFEISKTCSSTQDESVAYEVDGHF